MKLGYTRQVNLEYGEAVEKVKGGLEDKSFKITHEMDVKHILNEKLGEEIEDYVILSASKPQLVSKALSIDRDIGLMIPFNVIIYTKEEETYVSALEFRDLMDEIGNHDLKEVGGEIQSYLKEVIDNI